MKHHHYHHCLLPSLFDHPLILNTNTKDSCNETYTISLKNKDRFNSPPSLFYDSNPDNYGFVIVDGKVRKIKFDELNLDNLKPLSFSKLSSDNKDALGEYRLEKDSILWKIEIEEFEKPKINTERLKGKFIKEEIENYVKDFIKKINQFKKSSDYPNVFWEKDLEKNLEIELNEMKVEIEELLEEFDEWVEKNKKVNDLDEFIIDVDDLEKYSEKRESNIRDLKTVSNKWKEWSNKIKRLEDDIISKINKSSEKLTKIFINHKKQKIKKRFREIFYQSDRENSKIRKLR